MSREPFLPYDEQYRVLARLPANGIKTINGYSMSYSDEYPKTLIGIVNEKDFRLSINAINQTVEDYFPCPPCYLCGFLTCALSLGSSLFCKNPTTLDLEHNLASILTRINNRESSLQYGVKWEIKVPKHSWTSWIEISRLYLD